MLSNLTQASESSFKQQRLKTWKLNFAPAFIIPFFLAVGVVFLTLGIVFLTTSNSINEFSIRYDDKCQLDSVCNMNIDLEKFKPPVYFYYQLTGFYQNHRNYVKSKSEAQLSGEVVLSKSQISDCRPFDSNPSNYDNPENFYLPCGLIAQTMFNDTFSIKKDNVEIPLSKKDIIWESDRQRFKNPPADSPGIRVIPDFENEDFINWMRLAGLPDFRKLWRICNSELSGKYELTIQNNFPVSEFQGKKYLVISEMGWLGGKNPYFGIMYICIGSIYIALGALFAILNLTKKNSFNKKIF